jgi:hypothetical protein
MTFPPRFADESSTPRRWEELQDQLRTLTTAALVKKLLRFKNKPVISWTPDDWGMMDAINHLLAMRAYPGGSESLLNDEPKNQDEAYWSHLDERLSFYYGARYPGPEKPE